MHPLVTRFVLVLLLAAPLATAADGVIPVRLGATVQYSLDEARKANFAWRPKQTLEEGRESRIFLPYGSDKLFWQAENAQLTEATADKAAQLVCIANNRPTTATYRLQFDKPISGFRCYAGYSELVLAPECVAGTEYSVDGKTWTTLHQHPAGTRAVAAPFCDPAKQVTDLNTRSLFVRIYARQQADPTATGKECYLKLSTSGVPSWGDAETTFFTQQVVIWVRPR